MSERDGSGGYRTDVAYLRQFSPYLSPPNLRMVAALNGYEPPPGDDFTYCELGCGMGDTLATLAAANPGGRFWGVDLHPEHVAAGRGLATSGGLDNVQFLERDFDDLAREDLPRFDFVVAHGVLSWISPAKRRTVIEFARARLNPGGILYASYNALPGWAAVEPLRRLLLDATRDVEGDSAARARRGIDVARALFDGGARYFTDNPITKSVLQQMTNLSVPYVVHEYFHDHWHPMYFRDLAAEMTAPAPADELHFVGQFPLHLNYRALAIPEGLRDAFARIQDRTTYESMSDFATNLSFRSDVYVKGAVESSDDVRARYLDTTTFGAAADGTKREVVLPNAKLDLGGPVLDAVIPALQRRAHTIAELLEDPGIAPFGADRVRAAVKKLLIGSQAWPMARGAAARVAPSTDGPGTDPTHDAPRDAPSMGIPYRVPLAFNRAVLAQPLSRDTPFVMASPVSGSGLALSMRDALSIRLLTEVDAADRAGWLRRRFTAAKLEVRVGDVTVTDPDVQARIVESEFDAFQGSALAKLVELGVVERR